MTTDEIGLADKRRITRDLVTNSNSIRSYFLSDGSLYLYQTMFYFNNLYKNDKILDVTKFKAFADDKLNVAKMMICLFDSVENNVGK